MKQEEIEALLTPLVNELGYELWGLEYLPQGKHSLLRIYIDCERGINIDDCELVSHQISAILDVEDVIPGHFTLEVSSPGLDRQLFKAEHYQRYLGHEIKLKLYQPLEKKRKIQGVIKKAGNDEITLVDADTEYNVLISNIVKSNLIV
jgi:ribosome maturation factor RimP